MNDKDLFSSRKVARKIVPGTRGVTGCVPQFGKYESSLERDLMEILRFDPNVDVFLPQPLTIQYLNKNGRPAKYTPDGLIKFKHSSRKNLMPILYEVKYREDFRKDWKTLIPKFRAAKQFCFEKGYRFEVFTEREIRTPYLYNARFLWEFIERKPSLELKQKILEVLSDLEEADVDLLLCAIYSDRWNRARLLPFIWHLVAVGAIHCDLDVPLNMNSILTKAVEFDE